MTKEQREAAAYDIDILRRLEKFLKFNRMNDKWARVQKQSLPSRKLSAEERIALNIEIARIKSKHNL